MNREEAINVVRCNWPEGRHQLSEALRTLIPELQESEDERIRREMIEYFHGCIQRNKKSGFRIEQIKGWITYLEKQKEYIEDIRQFAYNKGLVDAKEKYEKEQKPAKWSEEDESYLQTVINEMEANKKEARKYEHKKYDTIILWLKSLRPQPKVEREPMEIKYGGRIYQVHGMRALPGGASGYIIEDEPGHYDCIMNPEEVLGGGYGVKQNGSPYPTKDATFDYPHWKPSEEQMRVFLKAVPVNLMPEELSIYKSLCNDIQKLK